MSNLTALLNKYKALVIFDTETTGNVTVRDRDTMQQEIVPVAELVSWLEKKLDYFKV